MLVPVIMNATVREVHEGRLLVTDRSSGQEVIVHTANPCRFYPGDEVRIRYSGIMTMSLPPQISAIWISRIRPSCGC